MIILDTHVLLWALGDSARLGSHARARIEEERQARSVGVSAITPWEIALLVDKGRLELATDVRDFINTALDWPGIELCPIDATHSRRQRPTTRQSPCRSSGPFPDRHSTEPIGDPRHGRRQDSELLQRRSCKYAQRDSMIESASLCEPGRGACSRLDLPTPETNRRSLTSTAEPLDGYEHQQGEHN